MRATVSTTDMADQGVGRFSKPNLVRALGDICAEIGLDPTGATLLRLVNNAVFQLDRHPVVVRIVGSCSLEHRVGKVVRVSRWLADHQVRAIRLVEGIDQPVRAGGYIATVWHTVPAGGIRPRGRDLGRLLRRLHELPTPDFDLPGWNPMDDVRKRLSEAEDLSAEDRRFLLDRCESVDQRLAEVRFQLPRGYVHGDAHLNNLIPSPDGPVVCDFDASCIGPREWDLVPFAVAVTRFGQPLGAYREMASTYGMDVTRWDGFPVLREVRELKIITSVLPIMKSNPQVRPELLRRLADYRRGDTSSAWAPYV